MAVQHVARVLGCSTLFATLHHRALPIAGLGEIMLGPGIDSPWSFARTNYSFAVVSDRIRHGDADQLFDAWADEWLEGVLDRIAVATAGAVRVGTKVLRDNVLTATASNVVLSRVQMRPTAVLSVLPEDPDRAARCGPGRSSDKPGRVH